MNNADVLSQTFPARISAVEGLVQAIQPKVANSAFLRDAANDLDSVGPLYGRASTAGIYAAFAELLRTVAMLVEWRAAVLSAESDAERFLRGARERHRLWLNDYGSAVPAAALVQAAADIPTLGDIGQVSMLCRKIASTPLPIGIFADESRLRIPRLEASGKQQQQEKEPPPELAIAFLRFLIDGAPADETHFLTPRETHDLEIEVRVSRWPEDAQTLSLSVVSIEPKSSYDFPVFEFTRPAGDPPFRLQQHGRVVLNVPQSLQARPFEFRYAAAFLPVAAEQPVAVVGQRTLRIEAIDLRKAPQTGYAGIDRQLIEVRDKLRTQPLITVAEIDDVLTVLTPLASLAGRAVQDALFKADAEERAFQQDIRNELRRQPSIASELEEHPYAGGGITDLSFHGIRIELKVVSDQTLRLTDCEKFAEQTASYVVATGKRVGLLCVLDNSAKTSSPLPAEEGIGVILKPTQNGALCIVTLLIQGNLVRPSDLSR